MGPHLQARTWSLLPILWVKFAMIKVFATWLLEADLPSPLRNGSHKMEYRQNAAGSAGSNNTYTACKAEECGCFNNWKKHHKLLLGILNVTKLSFFFYVHSYPHWPRNGAGHQREVLWRPSSLTAPASNSRNQEGLVKLRKTLTVGIATDSAHC